MRATVFAALLAVVLAGCSSARTTVTNSDDPRLVVAQFLAAREARNLEDMMDCFAEQPELHSSLGVGWTGREAVRTIIAYRLNDAFIVGDLRVRGNRVAWAEHVTRAPDGTRQITGTAAGPSVYDQEVEAVVVGGRIVSLITYLGGARPALDTVAADVGSPPGDLLVPLTVLVLVAASVLVWPSADRVRPPVSRTGHLMSGLQEYVARRG